MRLGAVLAVATVGWAAATLPSESNGTSETTDTSTAEGSVPERPTASSDAGDPVAELNAVLATNDVGPIPGGCPVVSPAQVTVVLERAGLDAVIEEMFAEVIQGDGQRGVTCRGSTPSMWGDDPTDTTNPPVTTVSISVFDGAGFSASSPSTCRSTEQRTSCMASETSDLFVVVELSHTGALDVATTDQVTQLIASDVIATLSGSASDDGADLDASITDDDLASAVAGWEQSVTLIEANGAMRECPLLSVAEFEEAWGPMGAGADDELWATIIDFDGEAVIACRPPRPGADDSWVLAGALSDADKAADVVASLTHSDGAGDDLGSDTTTTFCGPFGDGGKTCWSFWRRDEFIVGAVIQTADEAITDDDATALIIDVVPDVLAHLGDAAP